MTLSDCPSLLILGASTRAAAASAVRAGFHPVCADRFGDADLQRIATVVAVDNNLRRTLDVIKALPPMPWIYTGSIENDPQLIAAVSTRHSLLGNPPSVLKKVRDPFWLERTLRTHDLPALRVRCVGSLDALVRVSRRSDEGVQATGERWLLKPTRGGGGCRIAVWSGQPRPTSERFHFQEHRLGIPMSALFVASQRDCEEMEPRPSGSGRQSNQKPLSDGRGSILSQAQSEAELIGVCEQLIGPSAGAPTEFGYAGSIGPIAVSDRTRELLQRLGDTLTHESQLRGLFGIDFVLTDDIPWLVELNPRYTASVEVLERATGRALLADHAFAFDHRTATVRERPASARIIGKQIIYATKDVFAPSLERLFESAGHTSESPLIADIPAPDTHIAAGWPICTVFAGAENDSDCREQLAARIRMVRRAMIQTAPVCPSVGIVTLR